MGNGTSLGRQKERNVAARRDVGAPRDSCRVKWVRAREAEIAYNAPPWDPGGNGIDELIRKAEIETQTEGTNTGSPRRGRGGGMSREIGPDIYTLLTLSMKQITNENLLYRAGGSPQCSVLT